MDDGRNRTFTTGARRDTSQGKPRLDYLPWHALRSLGAYMLEKSERFGPCNYRRGMPLSELNASMLRHVADYQTAHDLDEEIAALHGVLFNASVALEQIVTGRVDLDDMAVIRSGEREDAEYHGHSVYVPPVGRA